MTELFDAYDDSYRDVVQSSIDFSGLPHSFFTIAKAELLGEVMAAHFGARRPDLLDIGCGVGVLHRFLRPQVGRLQGVDHSESCIARARRDNPGIDYAAYAGSRLPCADQSVDMALAVCVLHHVAPAAWGGFMSEMCRVVRPGGLVCAIEHNPYNPLTRLSVSRCAFDRDAVLLTARRTEALMRQADIGAPRSRYFLLLPSARAFARRLERGLSALPLGAQYMTVGAT
jgi:SAM-dependent methyltransferase